MANLAESGQWENGIYQIEQSDVVRGGDPQSGGVANRQAQQLANRTKYLYDNFSKRKAATIKQVSANITLTLSDVVDKDVVLDIASSGKTITVNTASIASGIVISFTALGANRNAVKIEMGFPIEATPDDEFKTDFWLHGGESFSAVHYGGKFYLIGGNIHLENIGEAIYGYTTQSFCVPANGTLVNRADFPRLWQMVSKYSKIVTDSQWLNGSGLNSGYFSSGNGTSTFRVPDLRGLFIRGLDGGRGIDLDRNSANIQDGSFQADAFKKHKHQLDDIHPYGGFADLGGGFDGGGNNFKWRKNETFELGSYETRPQNIALTPYIRF
jgi:hypothetical protein